MAILPDGKVLVATEAWPGFGSLVRLTPDGVRDPSFGSEGAIVDRRIPGLNELAILPDGRILTAAAPGFLLSRYLGDGRIDRRFGDGRIAGTPDPDDSRFEDSPQALLTRADGSIVVGGWRQQREFNMPQAIVNRYDSDGGFLETAGLVPLAATGSLLRGMALGADGSLTMAGFAYGGSRPGVLLTRFLPGSGLSYDGSFGGGEGLVQPAGLPGGGSANAIVQDGNSLVVAGEADDTFLLARFGLEGRLDPSFGEAGFLKPSIEGTGRYRGESKGASQAQAVAIQGDGKIVVAGGTTKWSQWESQIKGAPRCTECPQSLIARFTPGGDLDPSFGNDGFVRLMRPEGGPLLGEVTQVTPLADGMTLLAGIAAPAPGSSLEAPFLVRLDPKGALDASFGDRGVVILQPPCWEEDLSSLRRQRCIPTVRAGLKIRGYVDGSPSISLRVKTSLTWAKIANVRIYLPRALQVTPDLRRFTRGLEIGGQRGRSTSGGPRRYFGTKPAVPKPGKVIFGNLGEPRVLDIRLAPGALRSVGKTAGRKLVFRVAVRFIHEGTRAGRQTLILRTTG
jgi:uncharacterized delta-60 repeat protein